MTAWNNLLPSDVRDLKRRVNPSVIYIDALVARHSSLDAEQRNGWQRFVRTWRDYVVHQDWEWPPIPPSRFVYERGEELERELRSWKSLLSSQCPGVPAPATRRTSPMLGTWVTAEDVAAQKQKTDAAMRNLNAAVGRCTVVDRDFRSAWGELFRSWTDFVNDENSWLHAAAQFDCATAYEDDLAEWHDAFAFSCRGEPASPSTSYTPARPSDGPSPTWPSLAPTTLPSSVATPGSATVLALGACGLVLLVVLAKGAHQ